MPELHNFIFREEIRNPNGSGIAGIDIGERVPFSSRKV
jgi:hypothetical protein